MDFRIIFPVLLFPLLLHAEHYVMGVVPQQSPFTLLKVWQPVAHYLTERTGHTIEFKTEKSIPEFEQVLYAGGYDLAYMNPYHYVVSNSLQGYHARIRANKDIVGILVARDTALEPLLKSENTRFLFPSPNAFAATLLTKYELLEKYGVDVEKRHLIRYVNSHDSVYKGVARGIGEVGGGIERTLRNMKDDATKEQLHIVHRTASYPSHPIAFNPHLPKEVQKSIAKALLEMPDALLKPLSVKSFRTTDDAEYDVVRSLARRLGIAPRR